MSCKVGNRNHKERCTKYKTRGQRELNKEKKKERNQKRIARFVARREQKQKEEYIPTGVRRDDGSNITESYKDSAFRPAQKNKTDYAAWTSFMKRAQNQLDKEALAIKRALEAEENKNKKRGNDNDKKKKE